VFFPKENKATDLPWNPDLVLEAKPKYRSMDLEVPQDQATTAPPKPPDVPDPQNIPPQLAKLLLKLIDEV
jgi:hypothetical protein